MKMEHVQLIFRMLLTRAVRPDRLILAAKLFVQSVFGSEFVQKADALLNFEQIINEEVRESILLLDFENKLTVILE